MQELVKKALEEHHKKEAKTKELKESARRTKDNNKKKAVRAAGREARLIRQHSLNYV